MLDNNSLIKSLIIESSDAVSGREEEIKEIRSIAAGKVSDETIDSFCSNGFSLAFVKTLLEAEKEVQTRAANQKDTEIDAAVVDVKGKKVDYTNNAQTGFTKLNIALRHLFSRLATYKENVNKEDSTITDLYQEFNNISSSNSEKEINKFVDTICREIEYFRREVQPALQKLPQNRFTKNSEVDNTIISADILGTEEENTAIEMSDKSKKTPVETGVGSGLKDADSSEIGVYYANSDAEDISNLDNIKDNSSLGLAGDSPEEIGHINKEYEELEKKLEATETADEVAASEGNISAEVTDEINTLGSPAFNILRDTPLDKFLSGAELRKQFTVSLYRSYFYNWHIQKEYSVNSQMPYNSNIKEISYFTSNLYKSIIGVKARDFFIRLADGTENDPAFNTDKKRSSTMFTYYKDSFTQMMDSFNSVHGKEKGSEYIAARNDILSRLCKRISKGSGRSFGYVKEGISHTSSIMQCIAEATKFIPAGSSPVFRSADVKRTDAKAVADRVKEAIAAQKAERELARKDRLRLFAEKADGISKEEFDRLTAEQLDALQKRADATILPNSNNYKYGHDDIGTAIVNLASTRFFSALIKEYIFITKEAFISQADSIDEKIFKSAVSPDRVVMGALAARSTEAKKAFYKHISLSDSDSEGTEIDSTGATARVDALVATAVANDRSGGEGNSLAKMIKTQCGDKSFPFPNVISDINILGLLGMLFSHWREQKKLNVQILSNVNNKVISTEVFSWLDSQKILELDSNPFLTSIKGVPGISLVTSLFLEIFFPIFTRRSFNKSEATFLTAATKFNSILKFPAINLHKRMTNDALISLAKQLNITIHPLAPTASIGTANEMLPKAKKAREEENTTFYGQLFNTLSGEAQIASVSPILKSLENSPTALFAYATTILSMTKVRNLLNKSSDSIQYSKAEENYSKLSTFISFLLKQRAILPTSGGNVAPATADEWIRYFVTATSLSDIAKYNPNLRRLSNHLFMSKYPKEFTIDEMLKDFVSSLPKLLTEDTEQAISQTEMRSALAKARERERVEDVEVISNKLLELFSLSVYDTNFCDVMSEEIRKICNFMYLFGSNPNRYQSDDTQHSDARIAKIKSSFLDREGMPPKLLKEVFNIFLGQKDIEGIRIPADRKAEAQIYNLQVSLDSRLESLRGLDKLTEFDFEELQDELASCINEFTENGNSDPLKQFVTSNYELLELDTHILNDRKAAAILVALMSGTFVSNDKLSPEEAAKVHFRKTKYVKTAKTSDETVPEKTGYSDIGSLFKREELARPSDE